MLAGIALINITGCSDSNPANSMAEKGDAGNRGKYQNQLMAALHVRYSIFDEIVSGATAVIYLERSSPTDQTYDLFVEVENRSGNPIWGEGVADFGTGAFPSTDAQFNQLYDQVKDRLDNDGDGIWDWEDANPNHPDPDNPDDDDCNGPPQN